MTERPDNWFTDPEEEERSRGIAQFGMDTFLI